MNEVWAFVAGAVAGGGAFSYLAFALGRERGRQEAISKVAEG